MIDLPKGSTVQAIATATPLLEVKNLKTAFDLHEGRVIAVDGATFTVNQGETLGIVGESGCGKSISARSILRITGASDKNIEGEILYHRRIGEGESARTEIVDLLKLNTGSKEIREIRGAEISMIFQEPMTAFSPVHTIGNQIIEGIQLHKRAIDMLRLVEMPNAEQRIDDYPHQLSGGMRQRAMIAMALICRPRVLLADEPTTALDVTTQAQILNLIRRLKEELGMSVVMITHDLGVVAETAQIVAVMYWDVSWKSPMFAACFAIRNIHTRKRCSVRSRKWAVTPGSDSTQSREWCQVLTIGHVDARFTPDALTSCPVFAIATNRSRRAWRMAVK
jgi:peptide/nickel transport system ATP-binding protein